MFWPLEIRVRDNEIQRKSRRCEDFPSYIHILSIVFPLTDTRPHVHRGHEAIVTQTPVFPGNVGALASVTDVWSLLTLINI